jgi:hypothetical protein
MEDGDFKQSRNQTFQEKRGAEKSVLRSKIGDRKILVKRKVDGVGGIEEPIGFTGRCESNKTGTVSGILQ